MSDENKSLDDVLLGLEGPQVLMDSSEEELKELKDEAYQKLNDAQGSFGDKLLRAALFGIQVITKLKA